MPVQALFVDTGRHGIYPKLLGVENCWGLDRDAHNYAGPDPVVAHPPCQNWVNLAAVNYKRAIAPCEQCGGDGFVLKGLRHYPCGGTGRREPNRKVVLPAWYEGGDDGGHFLHALMCIRRYGGVLEHPAGSHAWERYGLQAPFDLRDSHGNKVPHKWQRASWTTEEQLLEGVEGQRYWVCEVWQVAYGCKAQKRTWLIYCGQRPPFELDWSRKPGTHQVGWFDRAKPTLSKREASATPELFAKELIRLAEWSRL